MIIHNNHDKNQKPKNKAKQNKNRTNKKLDTIKSVRMFLHSWHPTTIFLQELSPVNWKETTLYNFLMTTHATRSWKILK